MSARNKDTRGTVPRTKSRSKSPDIATEQLGLRTLVQHRLLKDVFQAASDKHDGWKILIVDDRAMHVISSCVGMYDIMEKRITLVESLSKKRAPFPDMGALYLVEPTEDSVTKIIEDFSGAKPLYGNGVFLYFLKRLPDELLNKIKMCKPLLKRLKSLSEINIDFVTKEERAFILDMRDSFAPVYLRRAATPIERDIAQKLVTVCATLNEYPHIRYKASSPLASSLATVFHRMMDEFVTQNPTWWYHGGPKKNQHAVRERGQFLILDRSDDCLTPLMHDFTYQALVHDLLDMDGDKITYETDKTSDSGEKEKKDVLLDEKDNIWTELRGFHIAKVIEVLSERIRDIMNSSTGSAFGKSGGGGAMSISQMASALKALPEYQEVMSKLSQHMHLAHTCMDVLKRDSLMDISDLEQTLATGKTDEGQTPKLADLIDQAEEILQSMQDPMSKIRLLLVLTVSQGGLKGQDRTRLINVAELDKQHLAILDALEVLGLTIVSLDQKKGLGALFGGGTIKGTAQSDDDAEYAGMRYVLPIKTILDGLFYHGLSIDDYPSVMPMPDYGSAAASKGARGGGGRSMRPGASSVRKTSGATSRWSKSSASDGKKGGGAHFVGGRTIIFSIGGLAYSEVSAARELMFKENHEVVIGSTAFISPAEFMEDLESLKPTAASDS